MPSKLCLNVLSTQNEDKKCLGQLWKIEKSFLFEDMPWFSNCISNNAVTTHLISYQSIVI